MSTFTVADAAAWLLDRECRACGSLLPGPGEPCAACGSIPGVTGPELAAQLGSPMALAAVQAAKVLGEARALLDQALARHAERARILHMGRLEQRRADAQENLDEAARIHAEKERELAAPLKAARKTEARAARDLEDAAAEYQELEHAEKLARKMKHGLKAETAAALALAEAGKVLARYQAGLADATAEVHKLDSQLAVTAAQVAQRERARDKAADETGDPGRIPVSPEALTDAPVQLFLRGALDDTEILMLRAPAELLARVTGLREDIEAQARQQLLAELEAAAPSRQALWMRADGRGNVTAIGNPAGHPAVPTQASPPGPGAGQGFSPALFPTLG